VTPEAVTSVITFVLNSALFSSFIIPQVQKLKEIKDQLFQFKLPSIPMAGSLSRAAQDSHLEPGNEVDRLQGLLDVYRIRSAELQASVNWFYGSVTLAAMALILSLLWADGRNCVLSIHPVLQLVLLICALKTYSTNPDRLSSPLYLVKNCEINPHLLIRAMGMSITFSSGLPIGQRQTWEDPLSIDLNMQLRVYGFRFLFFIADDAGKVYYASFGPVTPETTMLRQLLHPATGLNEIDSIRLGSFKFNQFTPAKTLTGHFLLFLPFFEHEKLNPLLVTMGERFGRDNLVSAIAGTGKVESHRTYRGITFSGAGEKVKELGVEDLPRDNNPLVNRVMQKLRIDFMRATKIESLTDLNGLIAAE
jgi:hypothetical protein